MSQTFATYVTQVCDICQNIDTRNFPHKRIKMITVFLSRRSVPALPIARGNASPTMITNRFAYYGYYWSPEPSVTGATTFHSKVLTPSIKEKFMPTFTTGLPLRLKASA